MRIYLAPMEGLLDHWLREILTNVGGFDICVSEFIRINQTLLPSSRILRSVPELQNSSQTKSLVPVKVQILGSDPVCMAENAVKIASLGAYGIDINFGCPAPTVNRNRGGSILLKEPELLNRIVYAVRSSVPRNIPVTAKMRLGYDSTDLALVCAEALEAGGASEIVVHARTKTDGYKPPAYWEWITKIKDKVKIPVIANGEIWDLESYLRCKEISGCEDFMIGRGAIANPALALMIKGRRNAPLSWSEIILLLRNFYLTMESTNNSESVSGRIKQWLYYLSREYKEANDTFPTIKRMKTGSEILEFLSANEERQLQTTEKF